MMSCDIPTGFGHHARFFSRALSMRLSFWLFFIDLPSTRGGLGKHAGRVTAASAAACVHSALHEDITRTSKVT